MNRIVYSVFNSNVDKVGYSVTDYKLKQFVKYKDKLINCKKEYAEFCGADFILVDTNKNDFVDIQFEKIRLLEKYANSYDELLYLDFDVVPKKSARNIFEVHDTSKICMHPLNRPLNALQMRRFLSRADFDSQNMFIKNCAKKSMLIMDGIVGNESVYNTGVILGNSGIIKQLNFTKQLDAMNELMEDIRDDHMYPNEIGINFVPNNEVYISYLIEKNNIPYHNLSMNWNYILDDIETIPDSSADLYHCVSKEFELII